MMYDTYRGEFINTDHIVTIRRTGEIRHGLRMYQAQTTDGGRLELDANELQDIVEATAPHTPASPGYFVITVEYCGDEEEEYFVNELPVLAWRITGGCADPVCAEPLTGRTWGLLQPDGRVTIPACSCYANRDEFIRSAVEEKRERAKARRERAAATTE